jgi:hypothetical protein
VCFLVVFAWARVCDDWGAARRATPGLDPSCTRARALAHTQEDARAFHEVLLDRLLRTCVSGGFCFLFANGIEFGLQLGPQHER